MKKIVYLLVLIAFSFSMDAQTVVKDGSDFYFSQGGQAADTVTASTTFNYPVYLKVDRSVVFLTSVQIDSVSGTPSITTTLQGSVDYITWYDIDTVITTTGIDTSFTFTDSVGNLWPFLRVNSVATATAQKSNIKVFWSFFYKL